MIQNYHVLSMDLSIMIRRQKFDQCSFNIKESYILLAVPVSMNIWIIYWVVLRQQLLLFHFEKSKEKVTSLSDRWRRFCVYFQSPQRWTFTRNLSYLEQLSWLILSTLKGTRTTKRWELLKPQYACIHVKCRHCVCSSLILLLICYIHNTYCFLPVVF